MAAVVLYCVRLLLKVLTGVFIDGCDLKLVKNQCGMLL